VEGRPVRTLEQRAAQHEAAGRTVSWIAQRTPAGPQVIGLVAFGDEPKATARAKRSTSCANSALRPR
jgi:P-type Cu+ transporter